MSKPTRRIFTRVRPVTRYQHRKIAPLTEGNDLPERNAAHAELRERPETEAEASANHDLGCCHQEEDQRRDLHVAAAAHDRRQRVRQPDPARTEEDDIRIGKRRLERLAPPAEHHIDFPSEDEKDAREQEACGKPDED